MAKGAHHGLIAIRTLTPMFVDHETFHFGRTQFVDHETFHFGRTQLVLIISSLCLLVTISIFFSWLNHVKLLNLVNCMFFWLTLCLTGVLEQWHSTRWDAQVMSLPH